MPTSVSPAVLTVSELNQKIRDLLEGQFPDLWVEGEVSDPRTFPSGHTYFTLKDAKSQIQAVLFQREAQRVRFKLEHGLVVLARGRVSLYAQRGQYQLVVSEMEPRKQGALQLAFEQLKAKLQAEGLFDAERKRPLPAMPQRIGIVTSREGAALRDMLSILKRRAGHLEILVYPVRVQGAEAKFEIVRAIEDLNRHFPKLEVLLVGRGGGSLEDLWAFNEEMVARAIAGSGIPVISCVGHETDFTIADFVADLRAPTPSAAAELVSRAKAEVTSHMAQLLTRLTQSLRHRVESQALHLRHLVQGRLAPVLERRAQSQSQHLDYLLGALVPAMTRRLEASENEMRGGLEKLHLLSPLAVLGRGYSIAFKGKTAVRDASKLAVGDRLELRLHKGAVQADVVNKLSGG
jgi:exodeoxyribonuclease VII large subunit